MTFNGSDFINNPWNTTFSPYTDLFRDIVGNGQVFFLFPLIIVTIGIQIKTQNTMMTTMFMLTSGALLGAGSLFINATSLAVVFTIFAAMGFVGFFSDLLFQR